MLLRNSAARKANQQDAEEGQFAFVEEVHGVILLAEDTRSSMSQKSGTVIE